MILVLPQSNYETIKIVKKTLTKHTKKYLGWSLLIYFNRNSPCLSVTSAIIRHLSAAT